MRGRFGSCRQQSGCDQSIEPLRKFWEDNKVAVVERISGTHHGEFMGINATGSAFEIEGVDILRVQDCNLHEHWGVMNAMLVPFARSRSCNNPR